MKRIPFGIARFDDIIGGGAPPGSTALLASEIGAGGRDFAYTSMAMHGLAQADRSQFTDYYGRLPPSTTLPESIHYLTFTTSKDAIITELAFEMGDEIVNTAADSIAFRDLAPEYFRQSHVPTEWSMGATQDLSSLGSQHRRRDVYEAIGDYLSEVPTGSLVIIDSVTDLLGIGEDMMDWTDITLLMKGLDRAFHRRGGLLLLLVNQETLSDTQLGRLMETTDGTLMFEWESGGAERDRTMFVRQFRGVLSRLEAEDIIRFETEITDSGFDISDVRKIR